MKKDNFDAFYSRISYQKHRERVLALYSPFTPRHYHYSTPAKIPHKTRSMSERLVELDQKWMRQRLKKIEERKPEMSGDSCHIERSKRLSSSRMRQIRIPLKRKSKISTPLKDELKRFSLKYLQIKKSKTPPCIQSILCRPSPQLSHSTLIRPFHPNTQVISPCFDGKFLMDIRTVTDFTNLSTKSKYRMTCLGIKTQFQRLCQLTNQAVVLSGKKAFVVWIERTGTVGSILVGSCSIRLVEGQFSEELIKQNKVTGRIKGSIVFLQN